MLLLVFCGPSRRLLVNRFFQTRHSFGIYLRRNTLYPHPHPTSTCSHVQTTKHMLMPSRLHNCTLVTCPRCN
jgi:hypothetical protein